MKTGWTIERLDDICEVILGQSPPGDTYNANKKGLPFFQGKAEFGDLYPTPQKWCDKPKKIAEKGDTLISVRAPVGPTNMCTEKSCIGRGLAALRPNKDIPSKYILYAVRATVAKLKEQETGSTFGAISGTQLKNHKIPLAPKDERKSIVEEIETQFTRLDAGVAALKRAQANLKRYRAAVLKAACEGKLVPTEAELAKEEGRSYETGEQLLQRILAERRKKWEAEQKKAGGKKKYVEPKGPDVSSLPKLPKGWAWATVEQVTDKIQYGYTASANKHADGIRFLRITDIQNGNVNWESVPTCKISKKSIVDYILNEGDIVFARTGATVGKSFRLTGQFPESVFASYLIRVIPSSKHLSDWLNVYFQSPDYWKQIILSSVGVGQPNVNGSKLSILQMPVPPVAEQQRIVEEVERRLSVIDKQEENINEKQKMAGNLRNAILNQAILF